VNSGAALQMGRALTLEQAEGNGTGWIYSREGFLVTNFHVLGSALEQAAKAGKGGGQKVARVTLLGQPPLRAAKRCECGCEWVGGLQLCNLVYDRLCIQHMHRHPPP
jgi:hypothetical protein